MNGRKNGNKELAITRKCTATMAGIVINTDGKMLTCPYLLEAGYYSKDELPDFGKEFLNEWKHGKIFTEFRQHGQKGCQARSLIFSKNVEAGDPYDLNSYKSIEKRGQDNNLNLCGGFIF